MTAPQHLLHMPEEDIKLASRANLQRWSDLLMDFAVANLNNSAEGDNVRKAAAQQKLMVAQLGKPEAKPAASSNITPSHLVEIRHAFDHEKECDLSDADEVEAWIRKILQAKEDFVDHLSDVQQPEAEALLARTARKYFSNEVRQSFSRQKLQITTVAQLVEAMESMYCSKLSIFQYLKRTHDVKYDKRKGLQTYVSELTQAQRQAFRHIERLKLRSAKTDAAVIDDSTAETTACVPVKIETGTRAETSTCKCAVKAHEFSDLTAACLAYLKITEIYPTVALKLCDSIDECRTAQDVFNKAKLLIDRLPSNLTSEDSTAFGAKNGNWNKKGSKDGQNEKKKPSIEATLQSICDRLSSLEGKKPAPKADDDDSKKNKKQGWKGKKTNARAAETEEAPDSLTPKSNHFRLSDQE